MLIEVSFVLTFYFYFCPFTFASMRDFRRPGIRRVGPVVFGLWGVIMLRGIRPALRGDDTGEFTVLSQAAEYWPAVFAGPVRIQVLPRRMT
ncbi:MAG TPA: hypothetical protein VFD58_03955 [Blastocatellia bacterium]|nr:hypothetical protein [Blastocatellia bacterium]